VIIRQVIEYEKREVPACLFFVFFEPLALNLYLTVQTHVIVTVIKKKHLLLLPEILDGYEGYQVNTTFFCCSIFGILRFSKAWKRCTAGP
jgi:hypothetical protein